MICALDFRPARRALRLAPLMLMVLACSGGDAGPAAPEAPTVARVRITDPTSDAVSMEPGATRRLSAVAEDAAGRAIPAARIAWSSSDASVASVDSLGWVVAVRSGTARIRAQSGAAAAEVTVQVTTPVQPQPLVEARALWVNRFEYRSEADIASIMQKAASAGFNIVYFQVRGAADAYYVSAIEPCAVGLCGRLGGVPSWDPLEVAVRNAREQGLQIHAWINALPGWGASSASCPLLVESQAGQPRHALLEHPGWAMVDAGGAAQTCPNTQEYIYLTPGEPAVRTRLARVAADIARRYAVDGIHLDRIRYPGTQWSYDPASRSAFGRDPASDPAGWADFRRERINLTVKETYDSLRVARPSVVLSAAVWGIDRDRWGWNSSQGYSQYFQDPTTWAAGGYLDVAVPMTYWAIAATACARTDWACLLDDHLARIQAGAGKHVYIGISAGLAGGVAEVERQVELARQRGAKGVSIYSYNAVNAGSMWPRLAAGVFSRPATVPPVPGK